MFPVLLVTPGTRRTQLTTNHNDPTGNKGKGLNTEHRARNEEQLKHIRGGSSNHTGGKLDRTWGETRQRYQSKTGNTGKHTKTRQ